MKKKIFLVLITLTGLISNGQKGGDPVILGNYLTFTPLNQTVSGNSGEDIFAQVLVNCYGSDAQPVFFNIVPCLIDQGYQGHTTNNGYTLYPGGNSTITFKFKKTVTTSSSFEYKFIKDNGSCGNNPSFIKITVNYTPLPTCELMPTSPTFSYITAGGATVTWVNVLNNNGYQFKYRKIGTSSWSTINVNQNQTSITLTSLLPQTGYEFEFRVKCANGLLSNSIGGYAFTTLPCNPPIPVLNDAYDITQNSAKISWQNAEGYLGIVIYLKRNYETYWNSIYVSSGTTRSIPFLQWNTTYQYKIAHTCTGNVGPESEIKTFTTLDSPSFIFPENVVIATINSDSYLEVLYGNGTKRLTPYYLKKIDVYSSEFMVGIEGADRPIFFIGTNIYGEISAVYPSILTTNNQTTGLKIKDISVGKPYKYNSTIQDLPVVFAIGEDNNIYYKLYNGLYTDWSVANFTIQSGPWTGQLKSIEASGFYSFYLMDSNRNCVRCDKNFYNGSTFNCYPISNYNGSNEAIGAAFENYNENPPVNTPSFYNGMYRVENNNTITYHYNFGDNESTQIPKPANEPDFCSNCSIDGFVNNFGQPGNFVFLPNNNGYYYNGTNWTLVAQNIKDISIGKFTETIGYRNNNDNTDISQDLQIENNHFKIYPIPASENLSIDINKNSINKKIAVALFDYTGKSLLNFESINKAHIEINLNSYVDGIYLLKLEIENEIITQKITLKH